MDLRHYPQGSGFCVVVIDCQRLTASVDHIKAGPLGQLGDVLERRCIAARSEEAALRRPSPQSAPIAKAAKPVVGLALAAGAKRPGANRSAPDQSSSQ